MALGIAHLLNYRLRGRTFFRVAILMPYATSLAAATVIFAELFDPKLGIINWALTSVHLPAVDWQGSKWPSQIAVSSIVIWRWTGYNALIYLAGMQAISNDLYEAAAIDGAGRWAQFRHVTLPGLRPTILFTIVVSTIGAAQLFGEPLLYHNGLADGGTSNQYQTLGLLMYQQGWVNDRLGPRLRHRLDHVRDHRHRGLHQRPARPPSRAPRSGGPATRRRRPGRHGPGGDRAMSSGSGSVLKGSWGTYTVITLVTIVSVFPLYYTIVMASHTNAEMAASTPPLLPSSSLWHNMGKALELAPLNLGLVNSLIVSGAVTLGTVALCTLAGFAFAKLRFRGSNLLLAICIATMMVPLQMGVIPLYMMMARIGLAGHLGAVILPSLCTAFGVFFMRQYIASAVPDELIEAAWIDGASPIRVFWAVVVPAVRPAMAVLGMLTFLMTWNDFFWPIIVLSSQNPTIQVSFQSLATGYAPQQSIIMAGTLYGTVPVLVVFALLGRQIVGGIMSGAVKG